MALRVWLPLNGTLENKGVSDDITYAMSSGNSFTSGGKIGNNALKLTKVQQILGTTSCMTGVKEVSYAFWVKVNTAWSTNWLDGIKWISTDGTSTATERQEFYENCTLVGTWYKGGAIYGGEFTPGVWTHLAATINYNTGEACFYVNGYLRGATSNVDTTYYCRGDFYIGDNGVDILQNDVRIYDHCLSAKEVKEISQGLILHYKLDGWSGGVNQNLALDTANKTNTATAASNTVNLDYGLQSNFSSIRGKKITISADIILENAVSTATSGNKRIGFEPAIKYSDNTTQYMGYWIALNSTPKTLSGRYSTTVTVQDKDFQSIVQDGIYIQNLTSGTVTIKNIKVELGDKATPWSPAPQDLGIDTAKITDSSGYGNDGAVTGTLSAESDSSRYKISTYYSGSSYTDTGSGTFNWFDFSQCTLSAWIKPTASVSGWSGSIGIQHNQNAGHKGFTVTDYANNFRVVTVNGSYTTIDSGKPLTVGEWHHCAAVLNGTNLKMYYDGAMVKESTISWGSAAIATDMRFATGVDFPGTDEKFTGNYSDVRMYCTALSAEDILDLYHTSANMDDLGNLHGFEFVEDNENKINKNGIIINNIFSSSIINNFTQTRSTQGWTLGGNLDTNGHAILVGTAPIISSDTFYVDNDDIYEINFNINMTSPSSSGDGLHLGITSSTNTIRCVYNWSSGTYTETDNASSGWNTYFVGGFKLTKDIHIKTYVVGANVNINTIKPEATDNAVTVSVMKIKSPMNVGFRAGYNTNTTMTLEFWNPSVIKINNYIKASIKSIETVANDFIEK